MNTYLRSFLCISLLLVLTGLSNRAFGQEPDMLREADKMVHDAWNPGGDPPSNEQRTEWIKKAMELTKEAPQRRVHRHRVDAIALLREALEELKNGDPDKKVNGYLRDADAQLRGAISDSV